MNWVANVYIYIYTYTYIFNFTYIHTKQSPSSTVSFFQSVSVPRSIISFRPLGPTKAANWLLTTYTNHLCPLPPPKKKWLSLHSSHQQLVCRPSPQQFVQILEVKFSPKNHVPPNRNFTRGDPCFWLLLLQFLGRNWQWKKPWVG